MNSTVNKYMTTKLLNDIQGSLITENSGLWQVYQCVNSSSALLCRNLEMILFGCQSSLCVVVELGEELPSPADIQLAHSRLRALCLGGGDKTWTHTFARNT